jgi:Mn2+/Fe2+ NRAMP family transporter
MQLPFSPGEVLAGAVIPRFPDGASLLVIGLIGTTIVPYNLFLASGIGQEQSVREMRTGIALAVGIGGLISAAILLVGTAVTGTFSYEALLEAITRIGGPWVTWLFGAGLFAAGFTSAVTAPLAAAITVQSMQDQRVTPGPDNRWGYRAVWLGVLLVGFGFGLSDVKPIPIIITAQAINGVLLPMVSIFLILAVNDPVIIPARYLNPPFLNLLMLLLTTTTTLLGVTNLTKAAGAALEKNWGADAGLLVYQLIFSLLVACLTGYLILKRRRSKNSVVTHPNHSGKKPGRGSGLSGSSLKKEPSR